VKILFVGDIVGKPGRRAVRELLPPLVVRHEIDLVIANCENAAAGFGVTREVVDELYQSGIHVLTTGNHVWDKREVLDFIEEYDTLLRPANYPPGTPGHGTILLQTSSGKHVGILNLQGRVFMRPLDCPFRRAESEIATLLERTRIVIVDFHAEATSEKISLGWFLDGRVSAVLGTHTHVQTADERILKNGTAYMTDVGMTGPFDSVIGVRKEAILERFLSQMPNKFEVAKDDIRLQGAILDIDDADGRARRIERINCALAS